MTRDDVECWVDDGDVRCKVEGQEVRMQGDHREVIEEKFDYTASLDSCAHMNEAFLQEYAGGLETKGRQNLGWAMFMNGCPLPGFGEEDKLPIEDNNE